MALDTLRSVLRPPSDVPLDDTERQFLWWRDRTVCIEFHHRRRDWWFRPGMETFGGRVLCTVDRIPTDRRVRDFCVMEMWKTAA